METVKKPLWQKYIYVTVTLASLLTFALIAWIYLSAGAKTVTVTADGQSDTVRLYGEACVADAFRAANITPGPFDKVTPAMDTQLSDGDTVTVERDILESGTPFTQTIVRTALSEAGKANELLKEAVADEQQQSSYSYHGTTSASAQISGNIIEVGGSVYTYRDDITVTATAYCPCSICCGSYANGITASGDTATAGYTVAASPDIPFGTKLYIPYFDRIFEVQDRGSAIQGTRLDIYFNTHDEALRFGIKDLEVYILE